MFDCDCNCVLICSAYQWLAKRYPKVVADVIEEEIQTGRLVEILPAWRPVEFAINALYPHRHQLSSKVRIFIDLMSDHFARHSRWLDLTAMS